MFGLHFSRLGSVNRLGLVQRALAILRSYGTDAHVYIPGVGNVSGLTAANFLDSAGTTSATVDNPVGLSLDALQAMTLGSERVTNPTINSIAIGGPAFTYYAPGGSVISGKKYKVSYTVSAYSGSDTVGTGNFSGAPELSGNGNVSFILDAASTSALSFYTRSTNQCTFLNISVREIPGIHATQATTANKPILRRGLLNLIRYSDDQSNAAWTNANLNVTPGQASSPYGTSDSALLAPTAVSGSHVLYQNNVTIARNVTMAFIAKAGVLQFLSPSNAGAGVLTSTFDLVAGTSANGASTTSSMVSLGGGWWLGAMSFTAAYTAASFYINNSGSASIASFAGNGVDGLYMYRAGLFDGTYTAQQIVDAGGIPLTTSAASNANAGKYSWQFDQSNDFLQTAITTGDVGWFCSGVTFTDSNSTLFCSGAGSAVQKGLWAYREALSDMFVTLIGNGTAPTSATAISAPAGQPLVIAAGWDASNIFHSVNNTENTATRTGSASPSPANLRIGAYTDGTTYPLGGNMNIALVFDVLPTATERLTLKRWVGQISGVSL